MYVQVRVRVKTGQVRVRNITKLIHCQLEEEVVMRRMTTNEFFYVISPCQGPVRKLLLLPFYRVEMEGIWVQKWKGCA